MSGISGMSGMSGVSVQSANPYWSDWSTVPPMGFPTPFVCRGPIWAWKWGTNSRLHTWQTFSQISEILSGTLYCLPSCLYCPQERAAWTSSQNQGSFINGMKMHGMFPRLIPFMGLSGTGCRRFETEHLPRMLSHEALLHKKAGKIVDRPAISRFQDSLSGKLGQLRS